jgi:hypothetical protein
MLIKALESSRKEVQDEAMRSLSEFPNDRPMAKLLGIAGDSDDLKRQVVALRGYVRMVERKKDNERCGMLSRAMAAARRAEEKKLVLGALGKIGRKEALIAVLPHLRDAGVANEAALAALSIGEKIKGSHRGEVIGAMQQVLEHVKDAGIRKRAEEMLKQEKSK